MVHIEGEMSDITLHEGILLKVFSNTISQLQDPEIAGLDIYYALKDGFKGHVGDEEMFHKTVQKGVLYVISKYGYDYYVMSLHSDNNLEGYQPSSSEHQLWYAEEFIEFLDLHKIDFNGEYRKIIVEISKDASDRFEKYYESVENEYEYYDYLDYKCRKLRNTLDEIKFEHKEKLIDIGEIYIINTAGRIFHDRQLCAWISNLLIEVGFPGEYEQWVERANWPTWVKPELSVREKGLCANCGANFGNNPSIITHIDHIIPISIGGCNDLVNLQLLCETCNTRKKAQKWPVNSSIPQYFTRRIRKRKKAELGGEAD